ncbi:MAG TPA: RNA polymerase sigma-70 factor [Cytophagales bacterium]|nr:RNA polymerase sigma-70 factor [Cytophagales bacterium]
MNNSLMDEFAETDTIQLLIDGEESAFETVFKSHFKALHAYAYTILRDHEEAEEVVQAMFLRLWERKEKLEIRTSLKAYLYRSIHNDCMNLIKHEKVKLKYQSHAVYTMKNETDNASNKVQLTELEERLHQALNKLPEGCRTVFQLSRFEELKYQEIADRLKISVKTVENQMGKALRILRMELADFLPIIIVLLFKFFQP